MARRPEDHQTRAAGGRGARTSRPGQGSRHPGALLRGRQPAFELADVPGARDVEREIAAAERSPDIRDGRIREERRPAALEHLEVEAQGAAEAIATEIAPAPALAQKGLVLLQRKRQEGLELVERQEDRMAIRAAFLGDGVQHLFPLLPGPRRRGEPGTQQEIALVEQEARVDVPRYTVQRAVNPVRVPDAPEVVAGLDDR